MFGTLKEGLRELRLVFKGNVGVMALSWFLFSLTGSLVNPFFAKYARDLGATDYDVALMRSLGSLALALSLLPGGFLTDYVGRVKVILLGTALVAVSQYLYAVAPDWRFLLVVHVFDMASHFYQPALTAIVMDSLKRGEEFKGFLGLGVVTAIPGLFMPVVGGVLYDAIGVSGLRLGFVFQGTVAVVVFILRLKALRETFTPKDKDLGRLILELAGYRGVLYRVAKVYVFTALLWQIAMGVPGTYGSLYALEVLNISKPVWGIVSSVSTLGTILASLVLLKRVNRYTRATISSALVVTVCTGGMALLYYINSQLVRVGVLIALSLASGIASQVLSSSLSSILTRILPTEVRGRAVGIQRLLENVGVSIASMVAATLYVTLGRAEAFIVSSVLGALSVVYLYKVLTRE